MDLLGLILQVHLGGSPVLALDVDSGEGGQVGDEVSLVKLIDLLFYWNNFERAKILSNLKLLHVQ